MNSNDSYNLGPWHRKLFFDPVNQASLPALTTQLQEQGRAFMEQRPEAPLTTQEIRELNSWYESKEGQHTLTNLLSDLWQLLFDRSDKSMPAHDARHALVKVPASALSHVYSEKVESWERIGVFGALLHDYGRWAEERQFGNAGASVIHARMSFVLSREALARYPLPPLIRNHILLSALQHTSGATADDAMPWKLTVAADREQLYGPEIILRLLHHVVGADGSVGHVMDDSAGVSVLTRLEHFLRNRLPGPLFSRDMSMYRLQDILCTFVLLCEDETASRSRFRQEIEGVAGKKKALSHCGGTSFCWERKFATANETAPRISGTLEEALADMLNAKWVCPAEAYKQAVSHKFKGLTSSEISRWTRALQFANEMRRKEDLQQVLDIETLVNADSSDLVLSDLGRKLIGKLSAAEHLQK